MEMFGARPELPLDVCLEELRQSNLVVLIVGHEYGSIEPESGLSYTHREFKEALECGIDVLALLVAKGEQESRGTKDQKNRLQQFRQEISNTVTTKIVDSIDQFPTAAMSAVYKNLQDRANRTGQFQAFQTAEDYFSSLLDRDAVFNHIHELVGRRDVLDDLDDFLASDQLAAVLPGAGGTGKSKLLWELAQERGDRQPRILFLGP